MRIELTVREPKQGTADRMVIVDCEPGTSAAALARTLGARYLAVDGRGLPVGATVGSPPLVDGALVCLDPPELRAPSPWELRVVRGPDVGLRFVLPVGQSVIGRAEDAEVRLTDPLVSRRHVAVRVGPSGTEAVDLGGANGSSVCGRPLGSVGRPLAVGDVLQVGGTALRLYAVPRVPTRAHPDGEGHLLVSTTDLEPARTAEIAFPDRPTARPRSHLSWVGMAVPLVMAGVLAAVMRSPTMLLFGLTAPVLSLSTWWVGRRRQSGGRTDDHAAAVASARRALADALVAERAALWREHPSPWEVLAAAETRSALLWSSSATEVRIGVGPRRPSVIATGDGPVAMPDLDDVPVTVDLRSVGLLGICGTAGCLPPLVGRLAVQAPPNRLAFYAVVRNPSGSLGDLLRRIPHTRAVVGPAHSDRLAAEVLAEIAAREDAARVRAPPSCPQVVVVLERWSPADDATWTAVVRRGPAVGVAVLAWAPTPSRLPAGRGAVLGVERGTARLTLGDQVVDVDADRPGEEWVRRLSRALAPLQEAVPKTSTRALPSSVRLLDLVGDVDAARLADTWSSTGTTASAAASAPIGAPTGALTRAPIAPTSGATSGPRRGSTRAVLGLAADGRFEVDLAVDGPHTLVAGTTGAGKSELLQTLVCSLALGNRPDELTFLLVDYKGGAAFRDCAGLPHVAGVVTDLDGQLTSRALTSLTAELRRRERALADAGAATVEEYRDLRAAGAELPALPRLVIVVDEFRVLAEELPEFVHGLVRIAAVGRSLGVHLVLATQRPGGVVTADIRANVSLRIALRVRDRVDSVDVLEAPDATAIQAGTPGRAFLRGAATPLTEFQSARVTSAPRSFRPLRVMPVRAGATPMPADVGDADEGPRDVECIVRAARGATRALHIPVPRSPWLPPLPDRVSADDLEVAATRDVVPLGLEDDPSAQVQRPWSWRVDEGHLGVAGGGRSGRSSAIVTVVGQLARAGSPAELHVYAVGPPALKSLEGLPHVAAVADIDDPDHVRLILERLAPEQRGAEQRGAEQRSAEQRRTQHRGTQQRGTQQSAAQPPLLRQHSADPTNGAHFAEEGAAGATVGPRVVLVVDGWERLAGHEHGALAAEARALLEHAADSRLRAVVTGGRALLAGQLAGMFAQRLVLRLADPVELALAGVPLKAVPAHQPPGRALDASTQREVQVALPDGLPLEPGPEPPRVPVRLEVRRPPGWPRPIRRLPDVVRFADLDPTPLLAVGARDGDLATRGFDPEQGDRRILVSGPPRSGRTNALEVLALRLAEGHYPVALVGTGWRAEVSREAVLLVDGTSESDRDGLIEVRRAHRDLAVLVDDGERLAELPIEAVLLEIARRVDEDRGVIVLATSTNAREGRVGALAGDLARAHTEIVLWPTGTPRVAGRAALRTPRGVDRIQVARISRR